MTTATEDKPITEMTAAEAELEMRRLSDADLRQQILMLTDDFADLQAITREQVELWRQMCEAVYLRRDTSKIADQWDTLQRKIMKAKNGKPDDLERHHNVLLLRALDAAPRSYRQFLDWDVCLHEAAHAVIAHEVGARVDEVSMSRAHGPASVIADIAGVDWKSQIKIHIAAKEALSLLGRGDGYSFRSDSQTAHNIARANVETDKVAAAVINTLREEVRAMLCRGKHARRLRDVATALSHMVNLDAAEFKAIVS